MVEVPTAEIKNKSRFDIIQGVPKMNVTVAMYKVSFYYFTFPEY